MRSRWLVLLFGAVVVVVLFAFPIWWPVVNRSPLEDALPGLSDLPLDQQEIIEVIAQDDLAFAEALIATGLADPVVISPEEQALPTMPGATIYASGQFSTIDAVRRVQGTVTVYEVLGDAALGSSWVVRLEDLDVRNGPELHVFLSTHPQPRTPDELRQGGLGFDLGPLAGTVGAQNFMLPAGFDMGVVQSVVIFSIPYQDVFSSAQLF